MYLNIHISEDDVFSELSDSDLSREMERRKIRINLPRMDLTEAQQSLLHAADKLRDIGQNGLAFRLDEIRKELTQ